MSDDTARLSLAQVLVEEMQALEVLGPEFKLQAADQDAALSEITAGILGKEKKLTALCFSGGGIRSATFCLGALQQLAKLKLLSRFDYLSTVSGGGFIGSWLKAWTLRDDGKGGKLGIAGVEDLIGNARVEPSPVQLLRYYSNYLAPRFSLLSADTWTIAATWLRNVLLTWLVLIPILMLPLLAPMLYLAVQREAVGASFSHWWLFCLGVVSLLYCGVHLRRGLPSVGKQGLTQGRFLRHCLLPLGLGVAFLSVWFLQIQARPELVQNLSFWSYCPWLGRLFAPGNLFDFSSLLGITVAFNLVAFGIGQISSKRDSSGRWKGTAAHSTWRKELGAMLLTAVVAAILIWSWITVFSAVDARSVAYAVFAMPALLAVFTLSAVFYIGVASYFTDEMDREFWARAGAWDLIAITGWIALSALALYGPVAIEGLDAMAKGALFGTGAAAGGIAARIGHSALTSAVAQARDKDSVVRRVLSRLGLSIVLLVFALVLMALLAWLATALLSAVGGWIDGNAFLLRAAQTVRAVQDQGDLTALLQAGGADEVLNGAPAGIVVAAAILLILVQYLMGRVIHVNKFSLHAAYANRIMRAYLGASRGTERKPNPFTGFDPKDNAYLKDFAAPGVKRPLHVINIALNLVHGRNLAWQERKASSFTATAFHCGGYDVGYRPSGEYAGRQGLSLGTAVTISGAAFTPNAGYHSSPLLTFVMAFFNVRLGWWLGNPARETWREPGPTHAAAPLVNETFGMTNDEHRWVYLSDGGHFDNLGLYEMVVRRVREIVVIDSGADPEYEFEDLGNAIRKIRADLGISIELERGSSLKIARRQPGGAYCAVFRIRYSDVHDRGQTAQDDFDGRLLYIKPALCGSEPRDVIQHSTKSEDFPHDNMADQFFTESQFESYRMLGMHELKTIAEAGDAAPVSIADLIERGRLHGRRG